MKNNLYWLEKVGKVWVIIDATTNGEGPAGWRKVGERYYTKKANAEKRLAELNTTA